MKKYLWLIVGVLVFGSITITTAWLNRKCILNGERVCYDEQLEAYQLEDNSELTVMVSDEALGDWLLTYFQEEISSGQLSLKLVYQDEISAWDATQQSIADIILIQEDQAAMIHQKFLMIDERILTKHSLLQVPQLHSLINEDRTSWIPMSADGLLFIYNKTMLEALGYNTSSVDEYNLPTELASWEKIFELNKQVMDEQPVFLNRKIETAFPYTVTEMWQLYPFLTASGWQMLESNDSDEPGFNSMEFFSALNFLQTMNQQLTAGPWQYEKVITDFISPFGVASSWMFVNEIEAMNEVDFVYSAYPTFLNQPLKPLAKIRGLAVLSNPYPSASMAVVDALLSDEAIAIMATVESQALLLPKERIDVLDVTENQKQRMHAYHYSVSEPLVAIKHRPSERAWTFYLEGRVQQLVSQMIQGLLSAEEVQIRLIEEYEQWAKE